MRWERLRASAETSDKLDVVAADFLERVGEAVIRLFADAGRETYEISTKPPGQTPLRRTKKVREA